MGTWNYRLVLMDEKSPTDSWYEVHEVHYGDDGVILSWTENAINVTGENPQDVMGALLQMARDINRTQPLKESELPKSK